MRNKLANLRMVLVLISVSLSLSLAPLGSASTDKQKDRHSDRIQIVARGLNGPYGLFFDGNNLLVTTKGELLRIKNPGEDIHPSHRRVERVASIGEGDALGAMLHGSKYMVLSCAVGCTPGTSRLQEISPDGAVADIFHNVGGESVEVNRWGNNFLVTDVGQNRILEVTPQGVVSVFATDKLNGPAGMYMDGERLWVTNFFGGDFLVIDRHRRARVVATDLGSPVGIVHDGLNFFIADYAMGEENRGRVLRVSKDGDVCVIAGAGSIGNPSALAMKGPDIYVSDILHGTITRIRGERLKPTRCLGRDCD